jgi:hypothetical protein
MKKMSPGMMAMMAKKKPMKMAEGGMPMVEKDGKKVPAFAADGKGKMARGGMAVKKMAFGGLPSQAAPQASAGMANRPAMPSQGNAGGARGLDRAAAMSGRTMPATGRPMKKGGMAHSDMAKDKPMMKKVAATAVKGHEKKMHGMAKGGGIETKGKTKGTMVKMKKGGAC